MRNAREYYGVRFQCAWKQYYSITSSMVYDDNDGQEEDCVSLPKKNGSHESQVQLKTTTNQPIQNKTTSIIMKVMERRRQTKRHTENRS